MHIRDERFISAVPPDFSKALEVLRTLYLVKLSIILGGYINPF